MMPPVVIDVDERVVSAALLTDERVPMSVDDDCSEVAGEV